MRGMRNTVQAMYLGTEWEKRIVWRCISRLEFRTKYCHESPTLDEGKPHSAILSAMNNKVMILDEVVDDATEMVSAAYARKTGDSENTMTLQERLSVLTAKQKELLDKVLNDMDNKDLNVHMQAFSEEKQILLT